MRRVAVLVVLGAAILARPVLAQVFKLAPAVAVEAEDFTVQKGWKVIKNGHGNYMVDVIGFNHVSGERLLGIDAKDSTASAHADVTVPEAGAYRLWVRYEYPAFCETRFRVVVEQAGKVVADTVMGKKDNLRYAFGDPRPRAQHDPSWGPEGLMEEVISLESLEKGKARIHLEGVAQPQMPGVAANRNIDLLYLTRDTADAWMKHYARTTNLYPLLDAFRDSRGPRWEVRFTNRGTKKDTYRISHVYNRIPWGFGDPAFAAGVKPGESSAWLGLLGQDTAHFGMVRFTGTGGAFDVQIRPVGGKVEKVLKGEGPHQVYLPPYPGKGEAPITPIEAIDAILADLKKTPVIGKKPTEPLCYGGWMPLGQDNAYGRKYAQLYAALGFRSLHPAHSGDKAIQNLQAAGVPLTRSWMVMGYRNPPTKANIEKAKADLARRGLEKQLRFFDYGDEIAFSEWLGMLAQEEMARAREAGVKVSAEQVLAGRWLQWLKANRPKAKLGDYWLAKWGPANLARIRPDSSAEAARLNPHLYVDSLLFYEEAAIQFAAEGARGVRSALGEEVLCGANYSCHPFYYPSATMYIKWFRGGAADLGRHSEYFWQVGQAGPMINGYIAEHFRAGFRNNPRGVLRQYTMPHSPGNTDASFLRSAYSHLAHGATMLDFFGIGLNETFTENHIDHRDTRRFRALREVTGAVGFVEDLLPKARPVPSPVALLVSESTERWDFAGIATDRAGHAHFGADFRKTRLHYHLERLGLWKALTFLGSSPDLVIEEDLTPKVLDSYKVLVVVGDHLPPEKAAAIEVWVKKGGVLLATAGAGQFDAYGTATTEWTKLFGLKGRKTEARETFFRPRQELPFLKPLGKVEGDSWSMPALAVEEKVQPGAGTSVLARRGDAAVLERKLDKGRVVYVAALPGVAYLWSALQPPAVPDRGPRTHSVPTAFDSGTRALVKRVLDAAGVEPAVLARPALLDARLLKAPGGHVLPVANYHAEVGQKVTLSVAVPGKVGKVSSAHHGALKFTQSGGKVQVTLPHLRYGDVLRLE
jgi:hypothetical protein